MTPNTPLAALRQRWWVVVVFAVTGAIFGALPSASRVEQQATTFAASHTMLANGSESAVISPSQVALFATVGEVPRRVAEEFGYEGSPAVLASEVLVEFDLNSGALTFATTQPTAEQAEALVDSFANNTSSYLAERQDEAFQQRATTARQRLQELEDELNDVADDLSANPGDPLLTARRDAVSVQYGLAYEQNRDLESDFARLAFATLESGQAVPLIDEGLSTPTSRSTRAMMGLVAGGFLGAIVAVVVGLMDRRIRSREQAEELLGMRARVLVPKVSRSYGGVVVQPGSHDPLSDSFRTIRNLVTFVQGGLPERPGGRVTLVVSPGPGDGKTSVAANLAAALAESGSRTVAANADFRRPALHRALTGTPTPESPLEIEDLEVVNIGSLMLGTAASRLKIVDFSPIDAAPGELVRSLVHRLDEMKKVSEQIVIDTSPVGSTAEVLDLVPEADIIVIVARVGRTSTQAMARAAAILGDIATAPIVFVLEGIKADRSQFYVYPDQGVEREQVTPDPADGMTLETVE